MRSRVVDAGAALGGADSTRHGECGGLRHARAHRMASSVIVSMLSAPIFPRRVLESVVLVCQGATLSAHYVTCT
jgi:hypothetical protein